MGRILLVVYIVALTVTLSCRPNYAGFELVPLRTSMFSDKYVPNSLDSLLLMSFELDSTELRDSFFRVWEYESVPVTQSQLQSMDDTLRAAYSLFHDFFKPDSQGNNCQYIVLQDSIKLCVLDSTRFSLVGEIQGNSDPPYGSLTHFRTERFRATVNSLSTKLYLTAKYLHALNYFINEKDGREPCILGPLDESSWHLLRYKEELLKQFLPVQVQQSGIGFNFISYPCVHFIAFSPDLSRARFRYQDSYFSGATVEFKRTDTGWIQSLMMSQWVY